ncbi:uncharacterized protein LOC109805727 [Cajanus cajan]|uniref:uncharacterized protein LOC109805727 n=1 Tax=Cajanus cajan TaxID=3821 RepID=UPI0010FBAD3B|nr:uncharacterized protein LOC109805727 [Cajanus cajan]
MIVLFCVVCWLTRVFPLFASKQLLLPLLRPPFFVLVAACEVILHDVIEIDNDDDSEDVVIIGEKVNSSSKGKTIDAVHDDHQLVKMPDYAFSLPGVNNFGSASGIASSNGFPSVSNDLINIDDSHGSEYEDDDFIDIVSEDYMDVDEYALLQKHFDNVDIPPGIEAPMTWLPPGYDIGLNKTGNSTLYDPWLHMQSSAIKGPMTPSTQSSLSLEPTNSIVQGSLVGSSNIQIKMDNVDHSSGMSFSPQLFSQSAPCKKKLVTSKIRGRTSNASLGVESSKSHCFLGNFHSKKKLSSSYNGFIDNSEAVKMPHAGEPPYWGQFKSAKKADGSSTSSHSNFIGLHGSLHPVGIDSGKPWWKISHKTKPLSTPHNNIPNHIYHPFDPLHAHPEHVFDNNWVHDSTRDGFSGTAVDSSILTISDEAKDEILRKFQSFKQFDTVEDTSDHYFVHVNSSVKQSPKNWAKKIQEEWKILQKDLPDLIFVRVYESRMDLLRAVIIGAEGTPYHDGLFFFDVFFPSSYPSVPPQVHYHSGGLRLNPNLYDCGKVCLSLLNTWSGNKNEKWLPGVSTILQVLVSIQGLILNTKPYFNEPGYARMSGSANGEKKSFQYNEDTFILSLRTMMYMIRRPPKNFEDFVVGHFCSRASDILVACKAYMEGAQVGCLVKGGVQDVDEGDKSCSERFKESLSGYMNMLVKEFAQIGAKDIEKFLPPATTLVVNNPSGVDSPVATMIMATNFLLSILFSLFTFFSFNPLSSYASQPSYKDHCASIVEDSTPTSKLSLNPFPLGDHHNGYYIGGDSIIDVGASWNRFSFYLSKRETRATQTPKLFKVVATISFRSTNTFSDGYGSYYGAHRRGYVTFKLDGFWHESSGKVCMVGIGGGFSKAGNPLNVNAVFKLNNVFNASNITSLVSGSLESLSPKKDENYFERISVLMFPKGSYNYSLDTIEVAREFSQGSDDREGLALNLNSFSFCKSPLSWGIGRLQLEYSLDCHSSKKCSISGSSGQGQLPSLMSLTGFECSLTAKKHRLRVLMEFPDIRYHLINQSFDAKTMLVGEGWWDEKNNMLSVVACHIMGMSASSLDGTHVGDCSVRLKLRFPLIWSIKNTSSIVGQIWSNKSASDPSYFKMVTFRNDEDRGVAGQGLKYEYSQLEKVNKTCPTHKPNDKGKRYPEADSRNMGFGVSVRESNKRVAWGYSEPLAVDDEFSESSLYKTSDSFSVFSNEVPDGILNINNGSLFNISYKISLSVMSSSKLGDRDSVFNLSSQRVKISAEGVYDAGLGTLCMVGCRDILSNTNTEIPVAHSVDCEILLNFQFPSLDLNDGSYIKGSIESTRKEHDPLYFKRLDLSGVAYYREAARRNVYRMDMEVIMALISTTLACACIGLQLYKVKREPNVLPFMSLIMMSILTLSYMVPLVLNFEALLTQNPNNKNWLFRNNGWLEVNETSVRLITMVAFLLQFRLLYLTWSARKSDESKKGLWIAERNTTYVTLPLYASGLLIALLVKLNKGPYQPSYWENMKSYAGLVLDGFLLPQIILNLFSNMRDNVLSCSFYFGTTFVRLLPHAYDLYRAHSDAPQDNGSYYYADPSEDFYSTAWDIAIPLGGILFAIIIYLQQRFGAHCILPHRFKGSKVYEKLPVVTESEAEKETTNM